MKTPLYDTHKAAGARIVDFAGWDMPVQYQGVVSEHLAVREAAGLFDVCHMGQLHLRGAGAVDAVNRMITNDLSAAPDGRAVYTCICKDDGGILDDAICYRFSEDDVLIVVNASNVDKIHAWMLERLQFDGEYKNESAEWGLLAIQGPKARAIAERVFQGAKDVARFHVARFGTCVLASTGYTGEDGFEVFTPITDVVSVWDKLIAAGADDGLVPVGLGARDTLRLEAKLCLYGNEIDETTTPIEAAISWCTKLDKPGGFIGRDAIAEKKAAGIDRRLVGLKVTGRGIARHGYTIHLPEGTRVGQVTSGTQSPSLSEAIALAYVDKPYHKVGTALQVDIRGRRVDVIVVKTPFIRKA